MRDDNCVHMPSSRGGTALALLALLGCCCWAIIAAEPLVYVVSPHYVPGACRAVASVRRNAAMRFEPHLLAWNARELDDVRERWRTQCGSILPPSRVANCSRLGFDVSLSMQDGWRGAPPRYRYLRAPHIWLRLCIVDSFPEWRDRDDALWYMDADTEVRPAIASADVVDAGAHAVCAVWDAASGMHLNSGVMRINASAWLRDDWPGRAAREMVRDEWANDQQVLARVALALEGGICRLDPRYNVMGLGERRHAAHSAVRDDAYVWHWTGPHKPWMY